MKPEQIDELIVIMESEARFRKGCGDKAFVETAQALRQLKQLQERYHDLLYQVASKFPDESRHDTAKRYIQQAENKCYGPGQAETILNEASNQQGEGE